MLILLDGDPFMGSNCIFRFRISKNSFLFLIICTIRFVNCLLEQPEVSVLGAGRGPAGSVIHKLFVNAQRVREFLTAALMPQTI